MKKFLPSPSARTPPSRYEFIAVIFFLQFILISATQVQNFHHSCAASRTGSPAAAACYQLQIILRRRPPLRPPHAPSGKEIDPRYGVEKRLVPSGPNPLHN